MDEAVNTLAASNGLAPAVDMPTPQSFTTAPLEERYQKRVKEESDLVVVVSDWHNRRGTGKTVLSLLFADRFDRTDEGVTVEKCSLDATDLIEQYTAQPEGSALVLDEAEAQASKYRQGSEVNMALRELVSMGRVEQKYLVMNLPASGELDRDLLGLADVWVLVSRKGGALVHLLAGEPYNAKVLTPKSEFVEWSDIDMSVDLRNVYNNLHRQKKRRLRGEEGDGVIKQSEVDEIVKRETKKAKTEKRNEIIRRLVSDDSPFGPSDVAHGFDITQQRIGQIAREG